MAFSTTFHFRRTCGAELAKWYKKLALFQTCLLFRTAVFLFAILLESNNDNPVLFVAPTPIEMVKIAHYAIVVACNCSTQQSFVYAYPKNEKKCSEFQLNKGIIQVLNAGQAEARTSSNLLKCHVAT